MAAITVTAAEVKLLKPDEAEVSIEVLGAALAPGTAVAIDRTTGKVVAADANAAGIQEAIGILLADARTGANSTFASGATVNVCRRGLVGGFDLSDLDPGDPAFVGDTAGVLDTAAGTATWRIGRVQGIWDQGDTAPDTYLMVDPNTPADV